MRSLALSVLLAGCVQPTPDSGARETLTHYLAEIRPEDKTVTTQSSDFEREREAVALNGELLEALREGYGLMPLDGTKKRANWVTRTSELLAKAEGR